VLDYLENKRNYGLSSADDWCSVISFACPRCPTESPEHKVLVWGTEPVSHFPDQSEPSNLHIIYNLNSVIVWNTKWNVCTRPSDV